ncbi:unnamed protein product, partial [Amoebophrya sp. A120]
FGSRASNRKARIQIPIRKTMRTSSGNGFGTFAATKPAWVHARALVCISILGFFARYGDAKSGTPLLEGEIDENVQVPGSEFRKQPVIADDVLGQAKSKSDTGTGTTAFSGSDSGVEHTSGITAGVSPASSSSNRNESPCKSTEGSTGSEVETTTTATCARGITKAEMASSEGEGDGASAEPGVEQGGLLKQAAFTSASARDELQLSEQALANSTATAAATADVAQKLLPKHTFLSELPVENVEERLFDGFLRTRRDYTKLSGLSKTVGKEVAAAEQSLKK